MSPRLCQHNRRASGRLVGGSHPRHGSGPSVGAAPQVDGRGAHEEEGGALDGSGPGQMRCLLPPALGAVSESLGPPLLPWEAATLSAAVTGRRPSHFDVAIKITKYQNVRRLWKCGSCVSPSDMYMPPEGVHQRQPSSVLFSGQGEVFPTFAGGARGDESKGPPYAPLGRRWAPLVQQELSEAAQ